MKGQLKHWLLRNDSGVWGSEPDGVNDVEILRSTDIGLDGSWTINEPAKRVLSRRDILTKTLHENDLVVVTSSGSDLHLGKTAIVNSDVAARNACFANFVQRLTVTPNADARYVRYLLMSKEATEEMATLGNTTTGLRNLNGGIIASVSCPGPPLEEQRAIADYLDVETARIDALTAKKQQLIHLLEERITVVSKEWDDDLRHQHGTVVLRRWVAAIEQGWSPVCDATPAEGGEWGVLKTSSVSSKSFNPKANKRLPAGVTPDMRWRIQSEDLLISRGSGSPDRVAVASVVRTGSYNLTISDLIYRVRLLPDISPWFVAKALSAPDCRRQIESSIRTDSGSTLKVRVDDLLSLRVPNVPLLIQSEVTDAVQELIDQTRGVVDVHQRQIELLKEKRRALITAAVTGEFTVPGAA